MGAEVVWTKKAIKTFGERITYLEEHWTEKEIFKFTKRVSDYLNTLKTQPLMFRRTGVINNTNIGVIIKEVSLVYRFKPKSNKIELIAFIDNRRKPNKHYFSGK